MSARTFTGLHLSVERNTDILHILTNNGDDVIVGRFQDVPGPGATHDFQCAGASSDQQYPWSDIALKFQQTHRFQERRIPETLEVGFKEALQRETGRE